MINIISFFLLIFFIQQSFTQIPPVVPLTNALTVVYCHDSDEPSIMTIRCGFNEKIRMLDAFDAVVKNKSHLPIQCLKQKQISKESNGLDCKVHTSFTSACSGRENCTLHMQRKRLNSPNDNCHNQFVDYTMAFFECISDVFIHNVCSSQAITSAWGTLQTPNFPNPYTASDDCWCKLSTQVQHRLLLSIIVFQLIPYDQHCGGAGLYLQSSNEQRSTQCTYLQQGHNYLSDANSLYINFYSRTPTVRGGFWLIYEASHPAAEVHLHCGPREKIGVPLLSNSVSPPSVSTSSDHGWSRLAFNNPPNPTTSITDHMMHMHLTVTTPRSSSINTNYKINTSTAVGAFTYPHGALATFDLAYGPRGWYLKQLLEASNKTLTNLIRTTTLPLPMVKWNFTWHYTQPARTMLSTTTSTMKTTSTTRKSTTVSTTTTERTTIVFTLTTTPTTTTRTHRRLLFTHKPWVYYSFSSSRLSTTTIPTTTNPTTTSTSSSSTLAFIVKTTLPMPTPWYSPAGPFDWWQWQWYTTNIRKLPSSIYSTTSLPTTTMQTTSTTRQTSTTSTIVTITASLPSTTTTPTTTRESTTRSYEKTTTTSTSTKSTTITNWFKLPSQAPDSNKKKPLFIDFDDEYNEWFELFSTDAIRTTSTTTVATSTLIPVSPRQQMDFLPTRSNWKIITINTPPAKRYDSQQNPGVSERNAVGIQTNAQVTTSNVHNMIRRVIEQRNKNSSMEYGWLSKTDMTIVAVSILFVILLAVINLILFAVRRHRHRAQGRHLLSTSIPSLLDDRRLGGNSHLHSPMFGNTTNSLINTTNNNNNNDILPAVGEIVIWDEKDQGGYMIDNNGAWAKIEGRQWFGSNIFKSCTKTSLSKSFRSRFRLTRHSDKKSNQHHQPPITPKMHHIQQQTFKFPLTMDTATLSPVPEADDYDSSDLSLSDVVIRSSATTLNNSHYRHQNQPLIKSERKHNLSPHNHHHHQQQTTKTIQALIHAQQQQNDDYYKHMSNNGDDSNYTSMAENMMRESILADHETDRSLGNEIDTGGPVLISVPTMVRRDEHTGRIIDGTDSGYNPHYSMQALAGYSRPNYLQSHNNNNTGPFFTKPSISTFKPTTSNPVIVGFCQSEFQSLDPKLLFQSTSEHQQFYRSSQSVPLSTYDSGFVDEQTVGSFPGMNGMGGSENNLIGDQKDGHMSMDDILLTKSEADDDNDDDDDDAPLNGLTTNELGHSNRQKWGHVSKRVSFQEEHVTQRFSPPPSSFNTTTNPETSSSPFDTYDASPDMIPTVPMAPPLFQSILPPATTVNFNDHSPTTSSLFTVQNQGRSIDNEDTAQNVIMNHLHSVKSLKKFFETKMVVQQSIPSVQTATITTSSQPMTTVDDQKFDRLPIHREQNSIDELEQRQEMMDKVLESLKKKKVYSRTTNDTPEPNGRYSAMTASSYDSNITQNLPAHRHYSRRFRSSSTSNNSLYPGGNIVTHINPSNSHYNKRAYSQDRQHYQTTDYHFGHVDKWKREQPRQQVESDEEDNISENSMLWQARTKLNEFVTRTRKNQQQSAYYATCANGGTPSEDLYTFDDNESVTAETRF